MFRFGTRAFSSLMRPMGRPTAVPTSTPMALRAQMPMQRLQGPVMPVVGTECLSNTILGQLRFKSRGNTYQPSMLKRKRRCGFLARLRTKGGRKILTRRREKGRWYLTY